MKFEKTVESAETIEEAKRVAVLLACSRYGVEEKDLEIKIEQEPVKKLFTKKNAIVSAAVKESVIETINANEIEKRKKAEEERKLEEQKRREEEAIALEEKRKIEKEQLEKLYVHIKERYLCNYSNAVSFPRYIQEQLVVFYTVFTNSPYMVNISIESMVEDWMKIEKFYSEEGFFDLETRTKLLPELKKLFLDEFDCSTFNDPTCMGYNIDSQIEMILHPYVKLDENTYEHIYFEGVSSYIELIKHNFNAMEYYGYIFNDGDGYSSYLNFARLYIQFLMDIVCLSFFFDCMNKVKDNQEFYTIINNAVSETNDNELCEKIHNIYMKYYIDTFDRELTIDELNVVLQCFSHTVDRRNSFEYVKEYLNNKDVDIQGLMDEIMARREGGTVYQCVEKLIEEGKFDKFVGCGEEAINLLFDGINYQMLITWPVELWAQMIFEALNVKDHFSTYGEKYLLLHPEITKKSTLLSIKEDYKNAITGVDFENVLKRIYESYGYKVSGTKTSGDQGADLILEKEGKKTVVQAKYYSSSVGNSAVQEVTAAIAYYKADKGIVVTNSTFTSSAISLASANNIELVDGNKLNELIEKII